MLLLTLFGEPGLPLCIFSPAQSWLALPNIALSRGLQSSRPRAPAQEGRPCPPPPPPPPGGAPGIPEDRTCGPKRLTTARIFLLKVQLLLEVYGKNGPGRNRV
jgi:hypothetical protein